MQNPNVISVNGVFMASVACSNSFEKELKARGYIGRFFDESEIAKCDGATTCKRILFTIKSAIMTFRNICYIWHIVLSFEHASSSSINSGQTKEMRGISARANASKNKCGFRMEIPHANIIQNTSSKSLKSDL